jgi:hypothetical protein
LGQAEAQAGSVTAMAAPDQNHEHNHPWRHQRAGERAGCVAEALAVPRLEFSKPLPISATCQIPVPILHPDHGHDRAGGASDGVDPMTTTLAKLLEQKQQLIERLHEDPGPEEREQIEHRLEQINTALDLLDGAG